MNPLGFGRDSDAVDPSCKSCDVRSVTVFIAVIRLCDCDMDVCSAKQQQNRTKAQLEVDMCVQITSLLWYA
jgi:hypothetical protein